jgi:hypothetical protein
VKRLPLFTCASGRTDLPYISDDPESSTLHSSRCSPQFFSSTIHDRDASLWPTLHITTLPTLLTDRFNMGKSSQNRDHRKHVTYPHRSSHQQRKNDPRLVTTQSSRPSTTWRKCRTPLPAISILPTSTQRSWKQTTRVNRPKSNSRLCAVFLAMFPSSPTSSALSNSASEPHTTACSP